MVFCLDAYNLIFKIASIGRINISSNENFSQLREIFILQMTNYFSHRRVLGILFFDGKGPGWHIGGNMHHSQFMQITYSGQKTADELMIKYIREHPHAREITVVTEDNEIIAVAKGNKCRIISSTDFITRVATIIDIVEKEASGRHRHVTQRSRRTKASDRKRKIISHMHFADIEDEFRKIDMSEILRELAEEDGFDYSE